MTTLSGTVAVFFSVLQHVRVHPCMAGDSGGQFVLSFACLEMVVGILYCFFHFMFVIFGRNVYKSSEFIKEFHVVCDMRRPDYKGEGGEEIKYRMELISCILFFLKQISICIVKV